MRLTQEEALDLFTYDPRGYLVSRVQRGLWHPGKVVGQKGRAGYLITRFDGKVHLIHRVVWTMFNGEIPPRMVIDHINGKRDDNRIQNLRLASRVDNQQNHKLYRNNKSGYSGVYWCNTFKRWKAKIRFHSRVVDLGSFQSFGEALVARKSAEQFLAFRIRQSGPVVELQAASSTTGGGNAVHRLQ